MPGEQATNLFEYQGQELGAQVVEGPSQPGVLMLVRIVRRLAVAVARGERRHSIFPLARTFGQVSGERADDGRHEGGPRGEELARSRREEGTFNFLEDASIRVHPYPLTGRNDSRGYPLICRVVREQRQRRRSGGASILVHSPRTGASLSGRPGSYASSGESHEKTFAGGRSDRRVEWVASGPSR